MKKRCRGVFILILLCVLPTLYARPVDREVLNKLAEAAFTGIDNDKNGLLSLAEFLDNVFNFDANKDGVLSLDEYRSFRAPILAKLGLEAEAADASLWGYDHDGNEIITRAELAASFESVDANNDALLSKNEYVPEMTEDLANIVEKN